MPPPSLATKYADTSQPCLISGAQALVRLLLVQHRRDAAAGLDTGGFVSGYRGSPVGTVDQTLWDAAQWLERERIVFQPGINEDLAATAVWGTQQLGAMKQPTAQGVFALWYGKGPGVDRSCDAIKHGNYSGTHPNGGVLLVLGDDHPAKSSTVAHQSDYAMVHCQVPILFPSGVAEFVRFGLLGWAMSRHAGCWAAFKVVNETIEQTVTIDGDHELAIVTPPPGELPPEGVHYRGTFTPARDEVIHKRFRLPLAQRFWRANRGDRAEFGVASPRLGIVTAGKAHGDVMQALRLLGIDEARARALKLDVYKVGMVWPIEPEGLREFAASCEELFFVEEKAALMEWQAASLLYNASPRPRIVGKLDEHGAALLPTDASLDPVELARHIAARLDRAGMSDADLRARVDAASGPRRGVIAVAGDTARRIPYFCSGCPHNTSTNVPQGSIAMSGIGCHGMAQWAKPGTTIQGTHMGSEGAAWTALQHFTQLPHVFQNMGDGTYYHSGLLAIRQAVAARANVTYKILFNDAIAMTGGQPVEGPLSPTMIAAQLRAEGVGRIAVVAEEPGRHDIRAMPPGVTIHPRGELDEVQRAMRETPGCTAIVYDQTCAAEKRRRRKRGLLPDPPTRVVINEAVCEGCGDCSRVSGCVSIEPVDTPTGRKRRINQSSCNKDYSCTQGFCPSFVTLDDAVLRKPRASDVPAELLAALPAPPATDTDMGESAIVLAGIGGTGVLTVSAVLAMAAHLQGMQASVYDMTGMAQKNGAVLSHLRLAPRGTRLPPPQVGLGEARVVIAFDLLAALSDESFRTMAAGTHVIGNLDVQPTAAFSIQADEHIEHGLLVRRIAARVGEHHATYVDATGAALALCGDAIAANFFMVGAAIQRGWLPLRVESVEEAIRLNGVQVEFNLRALQLGRLWSHQPDAIARLRGGRADAPDSVPPSVDALVADRVARLTAYQHRYYARRYLDALAPLRAAEQRVAPGTDALARTAAESLFRLMVYKDEYEVARLHSDGAFLRSIADQFEPGAKLRFHLAAPLFSRRDPRTGHLQKREYGAWLLPVFKALARFKPLRGTPFDPFGYTAERRAERALITNYEALLQRIATRLDGANHAAAVSLAAVAQDIKGYGHVKEAAMARAGAEEARRLEAFAAASAPKAVHVEDPA